MLQVKAGYTESGEDAAGSGLLVAWAVALGFNFMGIGCRIGFWVPSTALLSQQWGDCFILLFTLLLHCGVNQALFFWIYFLLVNILLIGDP